MKRIGDLFEAVAEPDNLRLAFWKASRGKQHRPDQREYAARLEEEIEVLRRGLLQGDYPVGDYTRFTVYDPKERVICAAAFRERVLHHALMNVCEPLVDRWLVFDCYACRVGKGQAKAVRRAQAFAGEYPWFLKADIRKFFDSVPHDGLKALLRRKFKDGRLLGWFDRIIGTYETQPGRGLPIGNLTSQHFANLYLDPLDRFARETLRGGRVRALHGRLRAVERGEGRAEGRAGEDRGVCRGASGAGSEGRALPQPDAARHGFPRNACVPGRCETEPQEQGAVRGEGTALRVAAGAGALDGTDVSGAHDGPDGVRAAGGLAGLEKEFF